MTATPAVSSARREGGHTLETLERAWDVYAGRRSDHTLDRLIVDGDGGARGPYFINDTYWWRYVDAQCTFHGTYGWRPFFDARRRAVDRNTWGLFFDRQVDERLRAQYAAQSSLGKAPPVGFFPHSVDPKRPVEDSLAYFYSNCSRPGDEAHARHDELIDFQALNAITAADWVLFERDGKVGQEVADALERFMTAIDGRSAGDGLLPVGPQGSQIEFSHGGVRYPATTHLYLWKLCRQLEEVCALLGGEAAGRVERWRERAVRLEAALRAFVHEGGWLVGALDGARGRRLGTGTLDGGASSYFETYPNLNAIVLGLADGAMTRRILARVREIPALTANGLVPINYPARPADEIDGDHGGFPPPGTHVNGGAWWTLAASLLYAYAREGTGRAYAEELLRLHGAHLTIDYYNDWGRDPAGQYAEKENGAPSHASIGAAGAFGMLFRGLLGIEPLAGGLAVAPRLPDGVARLRLPGPVRCGGKEVVFELERGGTAGSRTVLPFAELPERGTVRLAC